MKRFAMRSMTILSLTLAGALSGAGCTGGSGVSAEEARALAAKTAEPLEARIAALEERAQRSDKAREMAEQRASEALQAVIESRKEVDRLKDQLEDVVSTLGSGSGRAVVAAKPAGASGASAAGDPSLAAPPVAEGGVVVGSAAGTPSQREIDLTKAALAQIRADEEKKQQEERETRRKEQQARQMQRVAERLNLTPQQSEQLAAVWEKQRETRREMFETVREAGLPPDEMRATMEKLREEEKLAVAQILSPQQVEELTKMEGDRGMGGLMGGGFGGNQGGGRTGGRQTGGTQGGGGRQGGGRGQ